MKFQGCGTALVTPFRRDQSLDETTLRQLVRRQVAAGIDFLVPCGTTGESPTLTHSEHMRVVEITLEEAGEVPVLAGAGGYNTAEVIALARELQSLGAHGILSVTPYYNRPTQEGLYQHYRAIAAEVSTLPIVVYSVQGRTGVNVEPLTLKRLAEIDNIVGVKEASGNIAQMASVVHHVPKGFAVFSGDDAITIPLVALGGEGVISVASNEIPEEMMELTLAARMGNYERAREFQRKWMPLMDVNFVESNPIPVKAAMAIMGLLEPVWRLPMCEPLPANQKKIEGVLASTGLLKAAHAR